MSYYGSNFHFRVKVVMITKTKKKVFHENYSNRYRTKKKKKLKSSYIHPLIQNLNVIPKQKKFDKKKKRKKKGFFKHQRFNFQKIPNNHIIPKTCGGGEREREKRKKTFQKTSTRPSIYPPLPPKFTFLTSFPPNPIPCPSPGPGSVPFHPPG